MYITPEQLQARLVGQDKSSLRTKEATKTKAPMGIKYTIEEKALIGFIGTQDGQVKTAKEFGISHTQVGLAARGVDSPRQGMNETLKDKVELVTEVTKEGAKNAALSALMSSLGIVKDTVGNIKTATDASKVARNMSGIVRDLEPRDSSVLNQPQVNILIHAPTQKEETKYVTIETE